MKKKIVLLASISVTFIVLLILGATIMFNRSLPSDKEIAIANELVWSAKRAISNQQQTVLYEASRDKVIINAYGFMEEGSQKLVLDELHASMTNDMHEVRIRVVFMPPREYVVEKQSDGSQVSQLKKTVAIRQVELN